MEEITYVDGLWLLPTNDGYKLGLTNETQEELGEITFVSLPKMGKKLAQGDSLVELEAEKAVSEIVTPVTGTITAVNESAEKNPSVLNVSNELEAWIAIVSKEEK